MLVIMYFQLSSLCPLCHCSGAILASGACMSALAYLGVLCLAKWSPKARKKLEQYDPVGKAILNMLERQESMIGKSHVAGLPQHASTEKQKVNAAPVLPELLQHFAVRFESLMCWINMYCQST